MADDPIQALPVLRALASATSIRAMYPAAHPRVVEAVARLHEALYACLDDRQQEEVTFLVIEQELLVDDRPIRTRSLHLTPLVRTMNRLGVERLTMAAGLDEEEIHQLVEGFAGVGPLASSTHAVLGQVHLGEAVADGDPAAVVPHSGAAAVGEDTIDEVETSFLRFPTDRAGSVTQLDRMLWRLVEGIDQTTRSLLLLGPMKTFEQRLFAHSVNVALLTLAQARSLGIEGQALHDIGLAALLHDIGKMSLPRSLLHKGGQYTDREWEVVKLHPELGAAQLCGQEGVPAVAVLVAYEHHLRWDGQPSYPVPTEPRKPNLASQMTAIADTYDAMVAARGLTGGVHGQAARAVWQERSETWLDPFLVGNFVLMLSGVEE